MKRRALIVGVAASAGISLGPRQAVATDIVRIATLPIDTDGCAYYGQDQGFFREVGIDAQIQTIQQGSAIVSAILGGSIDIGSTNVISLAAAHVRGIPIVAVAPSGVYDFRFPPTAAIVVPKNSKIRRATDFNGKTMACSSLKSVSQWAPALWIDRNGGDSRQVQFTEMPFPEMPFALVQGRVDAAFPAEPFITAAEPESFVFADAFHAVSPRFCLGIWVTTAQWAQSNRDLVARFSKAIVKTARWANDHHQQTATVMARNLKLDSGVARAMARVQYAERLVPSELQPLIDLAIRYGALPPVAAEQLIYNV